MPVSNVVLMVEHGRVKLALEVMKVEMCENWIRKLGDEEVKKKDGGKRKESMQEERVIKAMDRTTKTKTCRELWKLTFTQKSVTENLWEKNKEKEEEREIRHVTKKGEKEEDVSSYMRQIRAVHSDDVKNKTPKYLFFVLHLDLE